MTAPKPAPHTPEPAPAPLDDMPDECPLCAKHGGPDRTPNAETLAAMRDAHERKNLTYYDSLEDMKRDYEQGKGL